MRARRKSHFFDAPGSRRLWGRRVKRLCLLPLCICVTLLWLASFNSSHESLIRTYFPASATKHGRRAIWRNGELPGGLLESTLGYTDEELSRWHLTRVEAAVAGAVVEPFEEQVYSSFAKPDHALLHIRYYSWDVPFVKTYGTQMVTSVIAKASEMSYVVHVHRPSISRSAYESAPCELSFDLQCQIPKHLVHLKGADDLSISLRIEMNGRRVGVFDIPLVLVDLPLSPLSICNKAMYGKQDFDSLLQWREHHRLLGFHVVHWQHKSREFGGVVARLNAATNGQDTFDWLPFYTKAGTGREPISADALSRFGNTREVLALFDEGLTVDHCYVMYRFHSDFIAIMDTDEWFSTGMNQSWTAEAVDSWRRQSLDENVGTVKVRNTWIDRRRFPAISKQALLAVDSSLDATRLLELEGIRLAGDGYVVAPAPDGRLLYKSIHNTRNVRHVHIHYDIDRVEGTTSVTDDLDVTIFHSRERQENFFRVEEYSVFPVTSSIIMHWLKLSKRLKEVKGKLRE